MPHLQTAQPVNDAVNSFGGLMSRWDLGDPLAVLVVISAVVYTAGLMRLTLRAGHLPVPGKRIIAAAAGFFALFVALAGPFDGFATETFWLHVLQHLIIALVAAPLLLLASPMPIYLWAMPETVRLGAAELLNSRGPVRRGLSSLTNPWVALPLYILTLYFWHFPPAFSAALENTYVHYLQHFSFFATAILFWWPIIGPAPVRSALSYPQRMLYLLLVVTPSALLGAIITLTRSVLYDGYLDSPMHWGMTPLEDQTMAGLLIWLPGNSLYLAALTAIFFTWAAAEEKKSQMAASIPRSRRNGPPPPRGGTLGNRTRKP